MAARKIKIGGHLIGEGEPVFIIAEAGVNHNGNINMAKRLVYEAKKAGADAVKFQTFKAENLNTKTAPKSTYHIQTTGSRQSWFDLLKSEELNRQAHRILIRHCRKTGIMFLSTPYDEESADLLEEMDVPAFKVASTDANNIPFLRYLAKKKRPIILSTAMCTLKEVAESVKAIKEEGGLKELILMHCTANYPADIENTNLRAMITLRDTFNLPVGYSDHQMSHINPIAATAMGAVIFEKHFTLDKHLPGPDHRSSLTPGELRRMVSDIRKAEVALGKLTKMPVDSEKENRLKLRKSIVARIDIPKDTIITREMITTKRPGTGLAPRYFDSILGKKTKVFLKEDTLIKLSHID